MDRFVTSLKARLVLGLMALAFRLSPSLRQNLARRTPEGRESVFRATFVFRTRDGRVRVGVSFAGGRMRVGGAAGDKADVVLTFRDGREMRSFFSLIRQQDILIAMLEGRLRVDGNLTYLAKFGHMSKALTAGRPADRPAKPAARPQGNGRPSDPWAAREPMRANRSHCGPTDKVRFLPDCYLGDYSLTDFPRLKAARERLFEVQPEICVERPRLVTEYYLDHGFDVDPSGRPRDPALRQAEALRHLLTRKAAIVRENDLLAGTTTTKEVGVVIYPEFHGSTIWPELLTVQDRALNPYRISPEAVDTLNLEVFPFWTDLNVREWSRRVNGDPEGQRLDERWVLYFMWKTAALSHTIPSFETVLRRGLADIAREAAEREQAARSTGEESSRQAEADPGVQPAQGQPASFYQAVRLALEGVMDYARRLGDEAERLAVSGSPASGSPASGVSEARRAELLELARMCRKVPAQPAETLDEALQAAWITWVALHMENSNAGLSLGRLDQVLQPYFVRDAERAVAAAEDEARARLGSGAAGESAPPADLEAALAAARVEAVRRVTERAVELVGWFFLKCADHLPLVPDIGNRLFGGSSSDQALTVGGVDASGGTAVNDMTYIILKVTELLALRDPNVNARYCPGVNSIDYLRRLCEVNLITAATPSLHNDAAVVPALVNQGFAPEDARDWAATGCVEPTSAGRHFGHTNCMLLNTVAALEMVLYNGVHPLVGERIGPETGDPAAGAFPTFESFKEAYKTQLRYLIERSIEYNDQLGRAHQYLHPTPLLSAVVEGPLERGLDVTMGGARYNSSGAALVAVSDVIDSLLAVKCLIYEKRVVDWPTLLAALRADFVGFETLHATISTKVPKFGQDHPEPLELARELVAFIYEAYQSHVNYRGGRYVSGFWSMSNHVAFGVLSGALPSGRRKGQPFTPGITPAPGVTDQLLPAIRTIAALDPLKLPNNIAFNVKLVPGPNDSHEKTLDQFVAYAKTYFELGGMQMQFNVVSSATLREAMAHPELYKWLLVRISGYNAYFVELNEDMQRELIARTEYRTGAGAGTGA